MPHHDTREKYVVKKLTDIVNEFRQLFVQVEENDIIPLRMQMVGAFTIIDVLGNYWFEYLNKKGTPSQRFYEFVEEFCLISKNDTYAKSDLMTGITKERLYEFRNSLVHFYGFGKAQEFALVANPSKRFSPEMIEKTGRKFRKRVPDIVIIQPQEFRNLITEGAALMLERMMEVIHRSHTDSQAKEDHINGIERIYDKLRAEGAEGVE